MPVRVIVNPAAGQGACGKAWPQIEAGLRSALGDIDVNITARAGDETGLARQGFVDGADHFSLGSAREAVQEGRSQRGLEGA